MMERVFTFVAAVQWCPARLCLLPRTPRVGHQGRCRHKACPLEKSAHLPREHWWAQAASLRWRQERGRGVDFILFLYPPIPPAFIFIGLRHVDAPGHSYSASPLLTPRTTSRTRRPAPLRNLVKGRVLRRSEGRGRGRQHGLPASVGMVPAAPAPGAAGS